jgi:hypothetical protein
MRFLQILKAAEGGAYDLFHFAIACSLVLFLFLELMFSIHHGWSVDPDFSTHFDALILAGAGSFPLRDFNIADLKGGAKSDQGAKS